MTELPKFIQLDRYVITARFLPSLIVVGPLGLAALPWITLGTDWTKSVGLGLSAAVAAYFLAQVTRDFGKRLEEKLWRDWGGPPSTVYLRHRDTRLGTREKDQLHASIKRLNSNLHVPTREDEERDPVDADRCYERMTAHIRSRTWGPKDHPMLFDENVSYGFKRNLLSLKIPGVLCALGGIASGATALWFGRPGEISLILSAVFLIMTLLVTRAGVRRQAENYVRRLFETVDVLKPVSAPVKASATHKKKLTKSGETA